MHPSADGQTVFVPKARRASIVDRATTGFPPDLLKRVTARLQILACMYAFIFFMAAFFPALIVRGQRLLLFEHPVNWAPGLISIAVALSVALAVRFLQWRPAAITVLALAFEVVSSYGIAAAEFLQPRGLIVGPSWIGLSWVSVWMLLFNVVVPTVPRYAAIAALASVTSVPSMVLLSLSIFPAVSQPSGLTVFFAFGFPYILIVIMAYVGARVVYTLGTEVTGARELGSYRLESRLGEGGMGEVWKASHRLLARPAAIKLIRASGSGHVAGFSDDMQRRFEREAQAIAQLRSPHTVTLFDFGIAEDGWFYYVMELLDGLDAGALIKHSGPIPAARAVHMLRQICHSLSEAESRGLVHRDIKPANIFVCRYGEDYDFVKVLDFGLVKVVSETSSQTQTAITMGNVIQGTPAFMAPEQVLGGADIDTRADIYSTGCVAYWLLTGELVFPADTAMKMLVAHAHAVPQPPSSKTTIAIPPGLDALVLSCLAKDRDDRPQSARSLLDRLDAIALSESWTNARAREWWDVHRLAAKRESDVES